MLNAYSEDSEKNFRVFFVTVIMHFALGIMN